jgi:adenylosuccinate synthase
MANVIVVGAQWGDEGKGKVVDFLTESADLVVRFAGGANAGHTLVMGDQRLVVHLLPSGVVHPKKRCLLGAGMVIDPEGLLAEIQTCRDLGVTVGPERVRISERAHVILPYHQEIDGLRDQGAGAIGTTRRGIGPCYEDKMARRGIRMWQLARPESLADALDQALPAVNALLSGLGGAPVDQEALLARYEPIGATLAPYLCDTARVVADAMDAGEAVLFEGAQGSLLDIDHGTYPFVTSSSTIAGGACTGAGVGPTRIDRVVGIVKAYQTRVGNGPFPTELTGEVDAVLRDRGQEFGATTGRPRRCGWLDVVTLRRAARLNGLTSLAITKLDVLTGLDPLRLCTGYRLDGAPLDDLPASAADMARLEPQYEDLAGFDEDITGARSFAALPENARRYLRRLEALAGVPIGLVSVGPRRQETIILENPFRQR